MFTRTTGNAKNNIKMTGLLLIFFTSYSFLKSTFLQPYELCENLTRVVVVYRIYIPNVYNDFSFKAIMIYNIIY